MSTQRLAPVDKSIMSPVSIMSPWKFDDLSASGSRKDLGSPGSRRASTKVNNNFRFAESPSLDDKHGFTPHKEKEESERRKSVIKLEKM